MYDILNTCLRCFACHRTVCMKAFSGRGKEGRNEMDVDRVVDATSLATTSKTTTTSTKPNHSFLGGVPHKSSLNPSGLAEHWLPPRPCPSCRLGCRTTMPLQWASSDIERAAARANESDFWPTSPMRGTVQCEREKSQRFTQQSYADTPRVPHVRKLAEIHKSKYIQYPHSRDPVVMRRHGLLCAIGDWTKRINFSLLYVCTLGQC